jgi:hypothetical protein
MAHGLKSSSIPKVHQALHGYADGHRQIALSIALKPRDQKTLLALSDISGPGAQLHEDGYLTGYPLTDSGFYALARTWPAPEMTRPGCVWTHTLLIDFNDLAAIDSPASLLTLFERPNSGRFHEYTKPKALKVSISIGYSDISETWARAVIAALYGMPRERIIAPRSSPDVDAVTLAIWLQQWPRLRRRFRFCTLAAIDRYAEGGGFDLQAISRSDRSVRSRFADAIEADAVRPTDVAWLEDAILDLKQPDCSGLRSFFRRLGSDIQSGREAFRPLCLLHRALARVSEDPRNIQEAVDILRLELGAEQAKTARALVARAALDTVDALDKTGFEFLWINRDALDPAVLRDSALRLARAILHHAPRLLVELQQDESVGRVVIDRLLAELPLAELTGMLKAVPELTAQTISSRAEVLGDPHFWADAGGLDVALEAARTHGHQASAVAAMVVSRRSNLAGQAVQIFGGKVTLDALNSIADMKPDTLAGWVKEAARDIYAVASFLAEQSSVHRDILHLLSLALPPDAVPNEYGDDPWCSAWLNSTGMIDDSAMTHLMAYLLTRALGQRSRSPAELAQVALELTHDAASAGRLTEDDWRILEPRLPLSLFWLGWDRCQRIRVAIVNLFVARDLSTFSFAKLAKSDQLFHSLAEIAAQSYRGQKYLTRVLTTLRNLNDPSVGRRLMALEKLLD